MSLIFHVKFVFLVLHIKLFTLFFNQFKFISNTKTHFLNSFFAYSPFVFTLLWWMALPYHGLFMSWPRELEGDSLQCGLYSQSCEVAWVVCVALPALLV